VRPRWSGGPVELALVRHGQSVGNEADTRAREEGSEQLDLEQRDADVELAETGRRQARALRSCLAGLAADDRPTLLISSPYQRAAETARTAVGDLDLPLGYDERLRERDLGALDGLTGKGIRAHHPEEAERREKLGKFYYQPPSGESWADVAGRVRSFLLDLRHGYDGERLWLFTHQAVILSFRYVLEGLSEEEILRIDRELTIPNASITTYRRRGATFEQVAFADTTAVDRSEADVTHEPDRAGRGSHEHA
jgi:broad specificity phosphatase PhoE